MKDYREQETLTDLKKYLKAQQSNIDFLLSDIETYTCRDSDNPYYKETFSITCYNPNDFIIFAYKNAVQNKNIQDSIAKVLKILNQKEIKK